MSGTTVAIIGGALVLATAAGVAVWYLSKQKQTQQQQAAAAVLAAVPVATPTSTQVAAGGAMTGSQVTSAIGSVLAGLSGHGDPAKATMTSPAPSSGGGGGGDILSSIGNVINTGKSIVDTVGNIFKGFNIF